MNNNFWKFINNIIAYSHEWQRPAKTEEWAYECFSTTLNSNIFIQLICFPWATLIDLLDNNKLNKAQKLIKVLQWCPPSTTIIRATVCQHIDAPKMLPWFKQHKITDLFWSHATKHIVDVDGILIHPFPLYPVIKEKLDHTNTVIDILEPRPYLYTFIGHYEASYYLTKVRRWIFDLPQRPDAIIERRPTWHFDKNVYGEQINGVVQDAKEKQHQIDNEISYRNSLLQSTFCLCPSGSGPNSIRLWEALECGCIPVILSDSLRLPGDSNLWTKAAIIANENFETVTHLPALLENIASNPHKIYEMRRAGIDLSTSLNSKHIHKYVETVLNHSLFAKSATNSRTNQQTTKFNNSN